MRDTYGTEPVRDEMFSILETYIPWKGRTEQVQMEGFLLSMYSFAVGNHCSCVAYSDGETVLFGRNSDFLTAVEPFCDSPLYRLEGAYGFVGATTAWPPV